MHDLRIEQLERWLFRTAVDRSGHRFGTVTDVFVDEATGTPEWLAVAMGRFGVRTSYVPLLGSNESGGDVHVAYDKTLIKGSPATGAEGELTNAVEEQLYQHYGLTHGEPAVRNAEDARRAGRGVLDIDLTSRKSRRRIKKE